MPMRPKGFRYDTLLRLRRRQEESRAQELASSQRSANQLRLERTQISNEQQHAFDQANTLMACPDVNAHDLRRYYQYERFLAHLCDAKDAAIHAKDDIIREQREVLTEAMKRRKMLDTLKEKREQELRQFYRKQEQATLDEAVSMRAAHFKETRIDPNEEMKP